MGLDMRARTADTLDMRHFRLWLFLIGTLSLLAQAVGAAAVFWHRSPSTRRAG
jgi:hypothetical protein